MNTMFLLLAETDQWADYFFGFDSGMRFSLLVILLCGITTVVVVSIISITSTISSIHRTRAETQMKREMVDRGMSAEEINSIIEAGPTQSQSE